MSAVQISRRWSTQEVARLQPRLPRARAVSLQQQVFWAESASWDQVPDPSGRSPSFTNVVAAPFVFRTHSVVRSCSAHATIGTACGPNPKSSVLQGSGVPKGRVYRRGYCCLGNVVAASFVLRTHSVGNSCSARALRWTQYGPPSKSCVFQGSGVPKGLILLSVRAHCGVNYYER